ncbi:hypothetical protein PoB_003461300 [Plakobranchus ocellatus]|uniref:Bursicon n=1 Tax=Plakobranchus ocellatus TaxID=259542 RepID=A0AAV4ALD3_9GAST|nr:hypothetical protein PoB_003461300 [Plakobranchus ocellatus]
MSGELLKSLFYHSTQITNSSLEMKGSFEKLVVQQPNDVSSASCRDNAINRHSGSGNREAGNCVVNVLTHSSGEHPQQGRALKGSSGVNLGAPKCCSCAIKPNPVSELIEHEEGQRCVHGCHRLKTFRMARRSTGTERQNTIRTCCLCLK